MPDPSDHPERRINGLTVRIDRPTCIGSGNCVKIAPQVFEIDDTGTAAFRAEAEPLADDQLVEACAVCPVAALTVVGADGKQIVPRP